MLTVVGFGPGGPEKMTTEAGQALRKAELIVGYLTYTKLLKPYFPDKEYLENGMRAELDRCREAVERAAAGTETAVVCSGDSGVYGMASLIYETAEDLGCMDTLEIRIIPGVTAALSGGAILGAPLGHDFAVISLSDLMTPRALIEKRIRLAAQADFCICFYNPSSRNRSDYLKRACEILLEYKAPDTVCGTAWKIGRNGEKSECLTLAELAEKETDMQTTVFIGNSRTRNLHGKMVTPRGYLEKYKTKIFLFAGTTEGRQLAEFFEEQRIRADIFVATEYGELVLREENTAAEIRRGRLDGAQMEELFAVERPDLVIDATHPYAKEASENIRRACEAQKLRHIRIIRESSQLAGDCRAADAAEAAALLAGPLKQERVLFTTGSKELPRLLSGTEERERFYARILPGVENLEICLELGIPNSHLICMQGPFSEEMNYVQLRDYGITCLVTKESGTQGGYEEKLKAAARAGVKTLVIGRPEESDSSLSGCEKMTVQEFENHFFMNKKDLLFSY